MGPFESLVNAAIKSGVERLRFIAGELGCSDKRPIAVSAQAINGNVFTNKLETN
jgi:hypothetical protein